MKEAGNKRESGIAPKEGSRILRNKDPIHRDDEGSVNFVVWMAGRVLIRRMTQRKSKFDNTELYDLSTRTKGQGTCPLRAQSFSK